MRLRDCVVKIQGSEIWLHHVTSSYRVRLNEAGLETLEALLAKPGPEGLSEDEALIYDRLDRRGLIDQGPEAGTHPGLKVLRKSSLQVLDLELSSRCNLQCRHCFAALDSNMMSRELIDRLFEGVTDLQPVSLVLNGGEPLLNPHWRYVVEEGRRRDLKIVVMTNGTVVTSDIAAFMGAMGVSKVIISLDGFEETHDALRGDKAFSRAVTGIRRLVAERVAVFVTTMVSPELLARREEFERYCLEELGVTGIRYSSVMPIGNGATAPERFQVAPEVLRDLHRSGKIREDHDATAPRYAERAWPCGAGVEQCFIASDGRVYECHYFQNLQESLGDLNTDSLARLYHVNLAGPVAERQHWSELQGCRDCSALAICHGGCRARAKLLGGSLSAPDTYSCGIHL